MAEDFITAALDMVKPVIGETIEETLEKIKASRMELAGVVLFGLDAHDIEMVRLFSLRLEEIEKDMTTYFSEEIDAHHTELAEASNEAKESLRAILMDSPFGDILRQNRRSQQN